MKSTREWTASFLLGLVAAPAAAQYDPAAPEPIEPLEGTILIWGGGALPAEMPKILDALRPEAEPRCVVLATPDADRSESLDSLPRAEWLAPVSDDELDAEEFLDTLRSANVVVVHGDPVEIGERWLGRGVHTALIDLLGRGGTVVALGDAAHALATLRFDPAEPADTDHPLAGLDLVPGAVLATGTDDPERRARLLDEIEQRPRLVALGVESGGALLLRRRWLTRVGEGAASAFVAASATRPMREEMIDVRRVKDLIALSRSAVARRAASHPPDPSPEPMVAKGSLLLGGGGRLSEEVFRTFVESAGGVDASILVVPCTPSKVVSQEPGVAGLFRRLGAGEVLLFHTKDRNRADTDAEFLELVKRATGIWFGGGRQWNFVDSYLDTEVHRLMHELLARGGVIGGSSAGASIQADYLCRGDPTGNLNIIAEGYERGLGFLTGVGVDQHFSQRGRHPDMVELIRTYPQLLGIGLDEGTAILVRQSEARVLGDGDAGQVFFFDCAEGGEPRSTAVPPGGRYHLAERRLLDD